MPCVASEPRHTFKYGSIVDTIDNVFRKVGASSWIPEPAAIRDRYAIGNADSVAFPDNGLDSIEGDTSESAHSTVVARELLSRPRSGQVIKAVAMPTFRRIQSVGSANEIHRTYTVVIRTYERDLGHVIRANPDCRFPGRHCRCFDRPHLHPQLIWTRLQRACVTGSCCARPTSGSDVRNSTQWVSESS